MSSQSTKDFSKTRHVSDLKIPPHSIEAEQAVLGGLMLDDSWWDNVQELLIEDDFFKPEHRLIFSTMHLLDRRNHPFDIITLIETLKSINQLENAGGEIYLFELSRNTPSVANIMAYANIVSERAILRRLIQTATSIADIAFNPVGRESRELLDEAESKIFKIGESRYRGKGPELMGSIMQKAYERVQQLREFGSDGITGLATRFTEFDYYTSGLQKSDLIIIAARPSMGKTTFAMNIAQNVAAHNPKKPVLIFSMEMPTEALGLRIFSSWGGVEQHKIRKGDLSDNDWGAISRTVTAMSQKLFFIDDTPSLSPFELRARARRIVKEHGEIGLIVIDYLQLMRIQGYSPENRVAEISEISRSLKGLAKELNVPIIALSQLNRSLEQRHDKRPVMSDLRESGAIEQDADLIVFIYRDEVYNKESTEKGTAEIIISKHRNGPTGFFKLTFLGHLVRFENYTPTHQF